MPNKQYTIFVYLDWYFQPLLHLYITNVDWIHENVKSNVES